ncbi:16S rRNA (guanine(966)-N(2))-methyltransferase RsmD [Motiliproteus coralliicola]|uniref:Ribosomal RNA small subunit methyltransferase D n=1 Tax=Motiliproteus coralliicola TaxID=2283196 RepID=A0A369WE61_9GAMM|nr:16S rRNA (guanine(966)-N(2))-methyltransferase RsmD [Motiliproteus coralliicola]RDE18984.1 16S rRNA (guanine(966)-N(2))-methyltransferase RsmD [Motiliproteus coralliicola]
MPRRPSKPAASRRRSRPKGPGQSAKAKTGQQRLRIIAGRWRGRKLEFADLPGLRPTTDRVRETLFNWLQTQLPGARVLDMFAGSGALGLEALSRGASHLTLVDTAAAAVDQLKQNLRLLDALDDSTLVQASATSWLQQASSEPGYDLVFLDPPYGKGLLADCCEQLNQRQLIRPGGWIYVEAESELQPLPVPANWRLHRQLKAGQGSCYLYQLDDDQ